MINLSQEEMSSRVAEADCNPCNGNSIHECLKCGEPYLCYACPDIMNPGYTATLCKTCLAKLINSNF